MNAEASPDPLRRFEYETLCDAYHRITDFRGKLLALLPLASGVGVVTLLGNDLRGIASSYLLLIAIFALLVTVGLYFYENRGVERCKSLIQRGKELEELMRFRGGLFRDRPRQRFGFIGSEVAGYVVYGATALAWVAVAIIGVIQLL